MKNKIKLEKITPLILGACLLALVACGADDDDDGGGTVATPPSQEEQQPGSFRAILSPVNANVSGLINGNGDFKLEGDTFESRVALNNAPEGTHAQHIHIGTACPEPSADTNADGFIDAVEAEAASGKILIPLDSDLRSQSAGGEFPSGASYNYFQSTSYLAMLADLKIPDDNSSDSITKLGTTEELNLEGKVVVIHGVPSSVTLPETVAGLDGGDPNATLPVACGVITRIQTEDTGTTTGETGTGDATTTGDTTGSTTGGETGETTGLSGI